MAVSRVKTSSVLQGFPKYRSMLGGNAAYIPTSFESIATISGTGSSGTITFSSIPSTYKHLQLRFTAKSTDTSTATAYNYRLRFNGDTGTNYTRHILDGDGAITNTSTSINATEIGPGFTPIPNSGSGLENMMGGGIIDIHDYSSTTKNKTVRVCTGTDLNRTTAPTGNMILHSGLWFATPAVIDSITLVVTTGSWTTSSVFSLYGIKG